MLGILVLTCAFGLIIGCEELPAPRHGSVVCHKSKCRFTCESWTDMLGSRVVKCVDGEWNGTIPICLTDITKCAKRKKVKCPKMDDDEYVLGQQSRDFMTEEYLELLTKLESKFIAMKTTRNHYPCDKLMCQVRCPQLRSLKYCKRCQRCKKRGMKKPPIGTLNKHYVICPRGGALFGR